VSTSVSLPPALRTKIDLLARRVRLLRAVRGVSLLVLVLVLLTGVAFLADYAFDLPPLALAAALALLAAAASLVAVFALVIPLCRPLDPEALAAVIEEKYPQLGERLTSTVELTAGREAPHGAAAFVALLVQETEAHADPLDSTRAVSGRVTRRLALAGALAVLLALVPGLLWPDRSADFGRRLLRSWFSNDLRGSPGYSLQVKPGDAFAAKDRPLVITVTADRERDAVPLPAAGFLVTADGDGKKARVPLRADRPGSFTYEIESLPGDLRYQVQAGEAVSRWYRITAVEPVELAAQSPAVTITPPSYVNPQVHPPQTLQGICELTALQYSTVRFDFRFTRPAESARVELTRQKPRSVDLTEESEPYCEAEDGIRVLPVQLGTDRCEGRLQLPALAPGEYDLKLVLEAEHQIATAVDLRTLTVWPDEPPAFTELPRAAGGDATTVRADWAVAADPLGDRFNLVRSLSAGAQAKTAAPDDVLSLKVAVEDKVGVDRAEVEYRVNHGPSRFETLFQAGGTQRGAADHAFRLGGKVKDGDVLLYRLKAADNRNVARGTLLDAAGVRVPCVDLGAQVINHPAPEKGQDRWFVLKIDRTALPLAQQEILAQRDDFRREVEAIRQKLRAERDDLSNLRAQTRNQPRLTAQQAEEVRAIRRQNRAIRNDLRALAREAAALPGLQSLADQAQDIAEAQMTRSDAALSRAEDSKADDTRRSQEFQNADQELARALGRLDDLTRQNDRFAQDRVDRMRLERLARREGELAQRTAELTAKDLANDPGARPQFAELKAEQAEVANELRRLAGESNLFKEALDAVRAEQAGRLAEQARELGRAQRELAQAEMDAFKQQNQGRLGELAGKQQELADQAARLAGETAPVARAADAPPLKAEQTQKAADALKQGDIAETLRRQEQSARDLEQGAADLDRARELARDPRAAARQLARLQDSLLNGLATVVKKNDPSTPLKEQVKELQKDEQALQQAVENLDVPASNRTAEAMRQQAAQFARRAAEALQRELPSDAPQAMVQARSALERLAASLPSLEQRTQQALQELSQLRRRQSEVERQAQQAVRQADKQPGDARTREQVRKALADAARRQAEVAERLSKLDVPQQQARHTTAQDALNKAVEDLVTSRVKDIPASQAATKRELENLAQALTTRALPPAARSTLPAQPESRSPRQMAKELAQRQRQLAQATQKAQQQAAARPRAEAKQALDRALTKLAADQAKLDEQAGQLAANKAQITWQQARLAMNQAKEALEKGEARAAQGKQTEAATALERLARSLPDGNPAATTAKGPGPAPVGFPSPEQSAQARALAQAQKDLRAAVQKMAADAAAKAKPAPTDNPVGALVQQQAEVARQAADLAKGVAGEQGQQAHTARQAKQAAQSAQQAARQMQTGTFAAAAQAGQQTAQQLRKLGQDLTETPRGNPDAKGPDPVQQAVKLAQQQEALNRQMASLLGNAAVQMAQQQARQQDLQRQTGNLVKELGQLAQDLSRAQARQPAHQAAASAAQAEAAMAHARSENRVGNRGQAQQAGQQAAQWLDQAAQQATQAARQASAPTAGESGSPSATAAAKTGAALQQGQQQTSQAQNSLDRGQAQAARSAMQQAAQAMQEAAQTAMQAQQPGVPTADGKFSGPKGAAPGGLPDPSPFGKDMQQYAGRAWGELPGELRTRILQDMRARYGEDYARIIQRYFQQIADTRKQ
jgi:hypothetical protein